ncbi:MAG: preprotein translocase subunit SecG [Agathobacter sp.]|mgnify:CR=1 FL=1|nr:preprotein translocase subunit SecG [Agathobacter sp.]
MQTLNTILSVAFIIISLVITVVILKQEGKTAGLGALSGTTETYWSKNKGRSMEGILVKVTRICVILFLALALVLNMGIW